MPKCGKKRAQRQVNKQKINAIYLFVPIILVLGVIPLIVQMRLVPLSADVRVFWTQNSAADFFSYYKSKALILVVIYMLCVFGYYKAQGMKDKLLQNRSLYLYFGATAIFTLFALLSTAPVSYTHLTLPTIVGV